MRTILILLAFATGLLGQGAFVYGPEIPTPRYSQTSSVTVASTSATSVVGTGEGDTIFRANSMMVGQSFSATVRGFYTTVGILPTFTITAKMGSATLASGTTVGLLGGQTNQPFSIVFSGTCRAIGPTGSFIGQGVTATITGAGALQTGSLVMTSPVVIDTTIDNKLDFLVALSALGGNQVTVTNVILSLR